MTWSFTVGKLLLVVLVGVLYGGYVLRKRWPNLHAGLTLASIVSMMVIFFMVVIRVAHQGGVGARPTEYFILQGIHDISGGLLFLLVPFQAWAGGMKLAGARSVSVRWTHGVMGKAILGLAVLALLSSLPM